MKNFYQRIARFFEVAGLNRAARELAMLSDRQLDDLGISRAKLAQGAAAYPWRETDSSVVYGQFAQAQEENFEHEETIAA